MKFKDIPAHLAISATQLAEMAGIKKQSLSKYLKGTRGTGSSVVNNVCDVAGVMREEIFFPDRFDHIQATNPKYREYYINIALEALEQAAKINPKGLEKIQNGLWAIGKNGLPEIPFAWDV